MNNTNYANDIVTNLEKKGESKDYILGFLSGTLNGIRYLESNEQIIDYLNRSVKQTQPA